MANSISSSSGARRDSRSPPITSSRAAGKEPHRRLIQLPPIPLYRLRRLRDQPD
jgi:hypothetical protein